MAEKTVRNSTADFLMFVKDGDAQGIQVYVQDETVWLSQKATGILFDTSVQNVNMHLKSVFAEGELSESATIKEFLIVAEDGKNRSVKHYNLDAAISVGYCINSLRATQFKQWATRVLSAFTRQGYVLDKQRLEKGN